jgi:tetratricopeptide (TPR) repeat protein
MAKSRFRITCRRICASRGRCRTQARICPRAERYARKCLSQEPEPTSSSHAVAHWRLGLVLEKEGRKADAVAEIETATKLDPHFEQAQKDLKRLRS